MMQTFSGCLEMYKSRLKVMLEFDGGDSSVREQIQKILDEESRPGFPPVERLLTLRRSLRSLLFKKGVPSNLAVDDVWILDRLEEVVKGLHQVRV